MSGVMISDDKNLPSIPPISVKVPETYPNNSPECDTNAIEYGKYIWNGCTYRIAVILAVVKFSVLG